MEKVLVTCPFTGLEFEAIKYADGRIVTHHAITGEEIKLNYNSSCKRYMLQEKFLNHVPMVTMDECAEELGISKPRISVLIKQGRLDVVRPNSALYITKESMLEYKRHQRKLAREKDKPDNGERTC